MKAEAVVSIQRKNIRKVQVQTLDGKNCLKYRKKNSFNQNKTSKKNFILINRTHHRRFVQKQRNYHIESLMINIPSKISYCIIV